MVPPASVNWSRRLGMMVPVVVIEVKGLRASSGAVPKVIVEAAVQLVCAGLQDHVKDPAACPAVLRRKVAGDGLEFGNRVRARD